MLDFLHVQPPVVRGETKCFHSCWQQHNPSQKQPNSKEFAKGGHYFIPKTPCCHSSCVHGPLCSSYSFMMLLILMVETHDVRATCNPKKFVQWFPRSHSCTSGICRQCPSFEEIVVHKIPWVSYLAPFILSNCTALFFYNLNQSPEYSCSANCVCSNFGTCFVVRELTHVLRCSSRLLQFSSICLTHVLVGDDLKDSWDPIAPLVNPI